MSEGVRERPVDRDPHQPHELGQGLVVHISSERLEETVDIAEIDRISRDRRDLGVHRQKESDGFVEIAGCRQPEELRALAQRAPVVGQQVAGSVRRVALRQLADETARECLGARGRDHGRVERLLREGGQSLYPLTVGQCRAVNERAGPAPQFLNLHGSDVTPH